ncbi:glycosyltransferase family 2 protein [Acidithiobacillus sp. AMEEHan]|uniref:glycosyltransferase family 2 protein n=1 Tax=Acidithiobacillus sp. AMEEHan TaxID=2994951 RepID=UPI0027E5B998|nr:glycosyltransferase family 2 protein [Acidithiobacillus sp. AMEEHan]
MRLICAIIISFNPDLNRLREVLSAVSPQVDRVQIVDNGSSEVEGLVALVGLFQSCSLMTLSGNLGVGAALNLGIYTALSAGYDTALLMDQDSIPSPTMVGDLQHGLRWIISQGEHVAAIGPRFFDRHSGKLSRHVVFASWHIRRIDCRSDNQPLPVDFLITSGSLVPLDAFAVIGGFNEELFIDHVDTEWVLRARSKGYRVFGDCTAVMEHDLGEYRRRIWLGRWREVPIHKPFRYYYTFRNSIWLRRRAYAPEDWRRADAVRMVQLFVFMTIFHPHRLLVIKMMWRGLQDGLRGRMGPSADIRARGLTHEKTNS